MCWSRTQRAIWKETHDVRQHADRNVSDCCRYLCGPDDRSRSPGEADQANRNAQAHQERPCRGQRGELLLRRLWHGRAAVAPSWRPGPDRDVRPQPDQALAEPAGDRCRSAGPRPHAAGRSRDQPDRHGQRHGRRGEEADHAGDTHLRRQRHDPAGAHREVLPAARRRTEGRGLAARAHVAESPGDPAEHHALRNGPRTAVGRRRPAVPERPRPRQELGRAGEREVTLTVPGQLARHVALSSQSMGRRTPPSNLAVVTGTTSGIGAALAKQLLQRGWEVAGVARRTPVLENPRYHHLAVDLGDVPMAVKSIQSKFGPLLSERAWQRVGLVNNAASASPLGPVQNLDAHELVRLYAINVAIPTWLMGFVVQNSHRGAMIRIVNLSSGAAVRAFPGPAADCGGKAALRMAGMAFAAELESPRSTATPDVAILS